MLNKVIYISQGNIPSKWAHSIQTMKMAEAFATIVSHFELLTQGCFGTLVRQDKSYLYDWYGIRKPFCIKRLPLYHKLPATVEKRDYFPRFINAAVAYARLKRKAVVYTREFHTAYLTTRWGIPTILERHGCSESSRFHFFQKTVNNSNLLGVVTISDKIKESYIKHGVPTERILVWPDAVDITAFENLPDKMDLRRHLNLPIDSFIATYCGHMYQKKGIEEILKSAAQLSNVFFLFVGGWEKDVAKYKSKAQHRHNVCFTGFVSNKYVPEYLGASDVLLMPNSAMSPDSWMSPLKMFEYMASRRPIIATNLPAFRGHLEHEKNALLVKPDDPNELSKAIEKIMLDPDYGAQLAHSAYIDVQPYTWENRVLSILQTFVPDITKKI